MSRWNGPYHVVDNHGCAVESCVTRVEAEQICRERNDNSVRLNLSVRYHVVEKGTKHDGW